MKRENFYLLLNLSIDPPENNLDKIDAAINKKRAEWSRYRNHPTKGIQAKQMIGLIPEIRRVMQDPQLRAQEAKAAVDIIKRRLSKKFAEVDRHLEIQMSKGFITDEEIFKLAKLHGVKDSSVRKRIQRLEKKKLTEVDKTIALRLSKGYITEDEIEKIAKLHHIDVNKVRPRVKGPIRKAGEASHDEAVKRLDQSIEKRIVENLRIVGKGTLYEFLDIPASASLERIQKAAKNKEAEITGIGKKDAIVTASGDLVGLCFSLFKTPKSRQAYDLSIAKSQLAEFNSDIDVAGFDGKIRAEYFDKLVERAKNFGMDPDEATRYITDYCRKKDWVIEKRKKAKRSTKSKLVTVGGLLFVLLVGGYLAVTNLITTQQEKDYQQLMANVAKEPVLEKQQALLKRFITTHKPDEFTEKVQKKINQIDTQIQKRDWAKLDDDVSALTSQNRYVEAIALYRNYIDSHPQEPNISKLEKKVAALEVKADQHDYQTAVADLETQKKITAYTNYLTHHPDGAHVAEIRKLLSDMTEEYYLFLKKKIRQCEKDADWSTCVQWCDQYIEAFPDNRHSVEFKNRRSIYRGKQRDEDVFIDLQRRANAQGENFEQAKQVYLDYLAAYPNTAIKDRLDQEIDLITQRENEKRIEIVNKQMLGQLAHGQERFKVFKQGVLSDSTTGLLWSLLDSFQTQGRCVTFDEATDYVKNLSIGGYSDWRLPTVKELAGIYKSEPYFPHMKERWYWTSESHTRYADGWSKEVSVVDSRQETNWSIRKVDSRECGTVRAVRKK
jgi:hypothetical protein